MTAARRQLLNAWTSRNIDWEKGRTTSPSPSDYLYDADHIFAAHINTDVREAFYEAWDAGKSNLELADLLIERMSS